jgi:hypothetical protein
MKSYLQTLILFAVVLCLSGSLLNAQVFFSTGKVKIRVDDYGAIRTFTVDGTDTVQHINRTSVLMAGNPYQVMDYWNDLEAELISEIVAAPEYGDFEIKSIANNTYSNLPPNFLIEEHVYGWQDGNYCLVKANVKNMEATAQPTLVGLDIVQYVDSTWENDNIFYDAANQLLVQYDIHVVGIKILSEPTTSAQIFMWYDDYEKSDTNYYNWLTEATFDSDTLLTDADGGVSILGGTALSLEPGASTNFYFAIATGSTEDEMRDGIAAATTKYQQLVGVNPDENLTPYKFALQQNYPNPFNPATKINFSIPENSFVTLKIYNAIGQEIARPISKEMSAGNHTLEFNANNLSSGIYFYELASGDYKVTRKMTLLK